MVPLSRDLVLHTIVVAPVICKLKRVSCQMHRLYTDPVWMVDQDLWWCIVCVRLCVHPYRVCVCVCVCMHACHVCVCTRVCVRVHVLVTGCRYICRMYFYDMFHTVEVCTNLHHCSMCKCVQSYVRAYVHTYS